MRIQKLIGLSRPRFWIYTAGPFLLGYTSGITHMSSFMHIEFSILFIFFLLPANIFIYGVNDYFDEETDKLNTKKQGYEDIINTKTKKYIGPINVIIFFTGCTLAYIFGGIINFILILGFFFFGYFYSAPPLRFKSKPVYDSLSNILYTIPALIGFNMTTSNLPSIEILIVLVLWPAAMHLFSAIPDIEADKKAGINTTAVYLGRVKALYLCFIYWGGVSIILYLSSFPFLALTSLAYPLLIIYAFKHLNNLFRIYKIFPYVNTTLGFILYIYILIRQGAL